MKTVIVNYYTIKELKEINAKGFKKAYNKYLETYEFLSNHEVTNSIEKFLGLFDCSWESWDCECGYVGYSEEQIWIYDENKDEEICYSLDEIKGKTLNNYLLECHHEEMSGWDNCPLTGIIYDIELLEPFRKFLTGEDYQDYSLKDLIDKGCEDLMKMVDREIENQRSEEYFIEECECNDLYFDINGNMEN